MASARAREEEQLLAIPMNVLHDQVPRRVWQLVTMMMNVQRREYKKLLRKHPLMFSRMGKVLLICWMITFISFGFIIREMFTNSVEEKTDNSVEEKIDNSAEDMSILLMGFEKTYLKYTGSRGEVRTSTIEIQLFDLNTRNYCYSLPNFPDNHIGSFGGYINNSIFMCGGMSKMPGRREEPHYLRDNVEHFDHCHRYSESSKDWETFGKLSEAKSHAAMVTLSNGDIWITGGWNSNFVGSQSTDIIQKDLTIIPGPNLPKAIDHHCMVQINDTHTMIAGGVGYYNRNNRNSKNTFFFNWNTRKWIQGQNMNFEHDRHGCVKLVDSNGEDQVFVIDKNMEMFNGDGWTELDVPFSDYGNPVVYQNMAYLFTKGVPTDNGLRSSVWKFDPMGPHVEKFMKLNGSKSEHVSFLIPKRFCK